MVIALFSTGLFPPAELNEVPRTIFSNDKNKNFYDQIAWFHEGHAAKLTLDYTGRAGFFSSTVRSTIETFGVGTRMATPSSFPFSSGMAR